MAVAAGVGAPPKYPGAVDRRRCAERRARGQECGGRQSARGAISLGAQLIQLERELLEPRIARIFGALLAHPALQALQIERRRARRALDPCAQRAQIPLQLKRARVGALKATGGAGRAPDQDGDEDQASGRPQQRRPCHSTRRR